MSVDCLKFNDEEKDSEMFLARVEWLPVTFCSHGWTDNCKISIIIRVSFRKMGKGGQNDTYETNGGAKAVRAIARLLGGSGGMLPQKMF